MRWSLLAPLLGLLLVVELGAAPGRGSQVNCNPAFVQSTVNGPVRVMCGAGRADLQRIAASLERMRREGRVRQADIGHRIAAMNEILTAFEGRFVSLESGMTELRASSQEALTLLRALSEGRLQQGPQYSAARVPGGAPAAAVAERVTIRSLWPTWDQVVQRYPELQRVQGQGPESLCMRCLIASNGSLGDCRLAGAESQTSLGNAARKMATLMRVYSPSGGEIGGRSIVVPITFGVTRQNQSRPRFCSMFDQSDYRF
jgi:hypothetical protein